MALTEDRKLVYNIYSVEEVPCLTRWTQTEKLDCLIFGEQK